MGTFEPRPTRARRRLHNRRNGAAAYVGYSGMARQSRRRCRHHPAATITFKLRFILSGSSDQDGSTAHEGHGIRERGRVAAHRTPPSRQVSAAYIYINVATPTSNCSRAIPRILVEYAVLIVCWHTALPQDRTQAPGGPCRTTTPKHHLRPHPYSPTGRRGPTIRSRRNPSPLALSCSSVALATRALHTLAAKPHL